MSDGQEPQQDEPIAAPELEGAVDWLNVASPITLSQLRGKVVILDFWTYGCVNCMHVLRDLKTLEQRFRDELVVVSIHSPKFTNEKDSENLRRILVRYEIEHPVANDANHVIWRRYGAQAWPTRVIIDPAGNLVGTAMGEGNLDGFVSAIRTVIQVFDGRGEISRAPLPHDLERHRHADRPLLYPGKVLADETTGRLFIADSNHNRIVVSTLDGRLLETIGSGLQGNADGIFSQARFHRPQGLALDTDTLYVADTENNRIRVVDFQTRSVETIGGDDLKSPWDLALKMGILIVAMAGTHQLWVIDLLHDRAYPYAGTGEEAKRDGSVSEATFAQPSGLALDPSTVLRASPSTVLRASPSTVLRASPSTVLRASPSTALGTSDLLYVADAESNTIRQVALPPVNTVSTIAGGDLFDFGDKDGGGDRARFQHPLGISVYNGVAYVADTYNHKIKAIDLASRTVSTFATGFQEPGGVSAAAGKVYVADTNNHAIKVVDIATRNVSTLTIDGLTPPQAWSYLRR